MGVSPPRRRQHLPPIWREEAVEVCAWFVYADQEMERLTAAGRDYLETVHAQLPAVPTESVVRFGKPAEEILAEAEAFAADVIVLATGRPDWFQQMAGGGLGQRLLRKARVPVVLVRAA
jgi:nucleotide-binding universal stress UspA family protein